MTSVLDVVGLTPRRKADRVKTYSGGMKRRVNLAAALIHDPPLLFDEPTAGVDPQSRNNLLEAVRSLASAGKTIIYTTHYMEEASKLGDRVAIMDFGKVIALGTVPELIRSTAVRVWQWIGVLGKKSVLKLMPVREIERVMASGGDERAHRAA